MNFQFLWEQQPPDKHKPTAAGAASHTVTVSPDKSTIFSAVSDRVYVFDSRTGAVSHCLKKHGAAVLAIACSSDGKYIATGSADTTVIVWSSSFDGLIKYTHKNAVQCLAFNPVTHQLASGDAIELGIWKSTGRSVTKLNVESKILSLSWSVDGRYLATGHLCGKISIRSADIREMVAVNKKIPIWALTWIESETGAGSRGILVAGCWNGTLSMMTVEGEILVEKALDYAPCFLKTLPRWNCLVIGDVDGRLHLLDGECREVGRVLETGRRVCSASCASYSDKQIIAVATKEGSIAAFSLEPEMIQSMHDDWFIQRNGLTDISIRHIPEDAVSHLSCHGLLKHAAIAQERVALQSSTEVTVYSLGPESPMRLISRFPVDEQSTLRCIVRDIIVFTHTSFVEMRDYKSGSRMKLYNVWDGVRCLSVVDKSPDREAFCVGCSNGDVFRLYTHIPIPQLLVNHPIAVTTACINCDLTNLALVDSSLILTIYDIPTRRKLHELRDEYVSGLCWSDRFSEMLSFSSVTGVMVLILNGGDPIRVIPSGQVASFQSTTVYSVVNGALTTTALQIRNVLDRFNPALYSEHSAQCMALMKTCDDGCQQLGMAALFQKRTELARKCFVKAHSYKNLDLVERLEALGDQSNEAIYFAELYCSLGRFEDAADCYAKTGDLSKAIGVFTEMKLHERGQQWAANQLDNDENDPSTQYHTAVNGLLIDQAKWSEQTEHGYEACEIYIKAGDHRKALALIEKHKWPDLLILLTSEIDDNSIELIRQCAELSYKLQRYDLAEQNLQRLNDGESLIKWKKAMEAVNLAQEMQDYVHNAHVQFHLQRDQFISAADFLVTVDRVSEAIGILWEVAQSHCCLGMFEEVGALYFRLAQMTVNTSESLKWKQLAEVYHVYSLVHGSITSVFSITDIGTLFNASSFLATLLNELGGTPPEGVLLSHVYYALFKSAKEIGAHSVMLYACRRLCSMHLAASWEEEIEVEIFSAEGSEKEDVKDFYPVCCRCHEQCNSLTLEDDTCVLCGNAFVRCFLSFEYLPVIEFFLEDGISMEAALRAIDDDGDDLNRHLYDTGQGAQVIAVEEYLTNNDDPFSLDAPYPIHLSLSHLRRMHKRDVLISSIGQSESTVRFFKIMDPPVPICVGESGHLFLSDEYDQCCLEKEVSLFSLG